MRTSFITEQNFRLICYSAVNAMKYVNVLLYDVWGKTNPYEEQINISSYLTNKITQVQTSFKPLIFSILRGKVEY